jgi:hypothetical protein
MHICTGKIVDRKKFPARIDEYAQSLSRELRISHPKLDWTVSSLAVVDRAARKISDVFDKAGIFDALVAYVGEVIRRAINGQWEMRFDRASKCWEPWVVGRYGETAPFVIIYDQLVDQPETGSLEGAAMVATMFAVIPQGTFVDGGGIHREQKVRKQDKNAKKRKGR